jgi:hypothetical protein
MICPVEIASEVSALHHIVVRIATTATTISAGQGGKSCRRGAAKSRLTDYLCSPVTRDPSCHVPWPGEHLEWVLYPHSGGTALKMSLQFWSNYLISLRRESAFDVIFEPWVIGANLVGTARDAIEVAAVFELKRECRLILTRLGQRKCLTQKVGLVVIETLGVLKGGSNG